MVPDPESRRLALELERWRGGIDQQNRDNGVVLAKLEQALAAARKEAKEENAEIKKTQIEQGKELVSMKVKVGIGSAFGGLLGAGLVAFATRGFG